jgi:phosphoribosylformylglycinamidine cyclo-ligase
VDGSKIRAGDALIALPSSGLHTNGYSLARRALRVAIGEDAAAERARLERYEPELGATLGDALMAPHRSYVREVLPLVSRIKGIAHITGGGALIENVARVLPPALGARIDASSWQVPPLFRLIQREANVPEDEMWRTFNMGAGLVLAVDASDADGLRDALPDGWVVGEVVEAEGEERVSIA